MITTDIALRLQAIDQADSAMVAEQQAIGELTDADSMILRERTKSEEHLVLLRPESGLFGCVLASLQELPDAVPEFR